MKLTLGDAVACHLFCHTEWPDGNVVGLTEFDESAHVGFNVLRRAHFERNGGPSDPASKDDFGTYLGGRLVNANPSQPYDKKWWIVVVKHLAFNGYSGAELYDSFEELQKEWMLE